MTFDYDEHVNRKYLSFQRTHRNVKLCYCSTLFVRTKYSNKHLYVVFMFKISIFNVRVYGYGFKSKNNVHI